MPFAYAAATEGCTFLLDEEGVCVRVLLGREQRSAGDPTLGGRTRGQAARQCVGAQYVASIDVRVEGALVPMPRVGMPMLFAYTGDDGRIAVVRTGRLLRFETVAGHDEIPVDWVDDDDDQCQTVPLHQSGERVTPRVSLFDGAGAASDTLRDPWVPPPPRREHARTGAVGSVASVASKTTTTRPTWSSLPSSIGVRLQKVNVVAARETAPTLKRIVAASGRGMLPRKNIRG